MVLAKDPWHSSVWNDDAETFHIRLRVTSKFLLSKLFHMNYEMSVYQSTGQCPYFSVSNFISHCNFLFVFFINAYQGNEGIKKNTETYSVLKFTVLCDVIVLLLWFLQNSGEREAVCTGFWRMPSSRVTSHAVRVLDCGSSTKNAWIKGVLV
jgi:hypothetical protein